MATTNVLSGTGNINYTNTTGKNVRVILNYVKGSGTISWGNPSSLATATVSQSAFGKNLCSARIELATTEHKSYPFANQFLLFSSRSFSSQYNSKNISSSNSSTPIGIPIEYIIAPNSVFKMQGNVTAYNILTITEN